MKRIVAAVAFVLSAFACSPAFAQETEPPPVQGEYAPPASPQVAEQGEWVETDTYGWIWVPLATETVVVQSRPYAYFYTPSYGWTWYVSPWGVGRYSRGAWVHNRFEAHAYYRGRWVAPRHFAPPAHRAAVARPAHRAHGRRAARSHHAGRHVAHGAHHAPHAHHGRRRR